MDRKRESAGEPARQSGSERELPKMEREGLSGDGGSWRLLGGEKYFPSLRPPISHSVSSSLLTACLLHRLGGRAG